VPNDSSPWVDEAELRRRAEERLVASKQAAVGPTPGPDDARRWVHELEVHQIELELQNAELMRSRGLVEDALARYSDLYDFAPVGYFTLDTDGTILQANLAGSRLLQVERRSLVGARLALFLSPADRAAFAAFLERVFATRVPEACELTLCPPSAGPGVLWPEQERVDGDPARIVRIEAASSEDGGECRAAVTDVTERWWAEWQLRVSEERYKEFVEGTEDLVAQIDSDGCFRFVNHAGMAVLGLTPEQCAGLAMLEFVHPDDRQRTERWLAQTIEAGLASASIENRTVSRAGLVREMQWIARFHYDHAGRPTVINSIGRDVTESRRRESERRQLEKLEALVVLSGGIAHDFNNLLTVVLGHTGLALAELPQDGPAALHLSAAIQAGERAAELVAQICDYSGAGTPPQSQVDLSRVVDEAIRLTLPRLKGDHGLRLKLSSGLPLIRGDERQIQRVVSSLLLNAWEALDGVGGTVTVRTGVASADEVCPADVHVVEGALPPGRCVLLEVADTGSGMGEEVRERIFEPFFTTKFAGRGLGLPAAAGIVRVHEGAIHVRTTPGEGSTFTVLFPCEEPQT
jgi:PAS domain S-box-containing protein